MVAPTNLPTKPVKALKTQTSTGALPAGVKPKAKARVLIVDDHAVVRRGIAQLITDEPDLEVCGEAGTAREALRFLRDTTPSLVIVDLSLADEHGVELIKQIKAMCADMPIVVLSMHDEQVYAERVLRAGARGYVMKAVNIDSLIHAIRTVLRGEVYLSDAMSTRVLGRMIGARQEKPGPSVQQLTDRELAVFELLGKGRGTREIANALCVSVKTIESHREKIKAKLGLKSGNELIHAAMHWVVQEGGE